MSGMFGLLVGAIGGANPASGTTLRPEPLFAPAPLGIGLESSTAIYSRAVNFFNASDFKSSEEELSRLLAREPAKNEWREFRAQVRIDAKLFEEAIDDFNIALNTTDAITDRARLLAGRALAHEGLSHWEDSLNDYNSAIQLASSSALEPDPYVLNSRGNVKASLGLYDDARIDYCNAAEGFRRAKGFFDNTGMSSARLDGEMFARGNAALMLVQIGSEDIALKEMKAIILKAPGNTDMRAALAALYWHSNDQLAAETQWEFACDHISTGCRLYQDTDWLYRIRRWPPIMVTRLKSFLDFKAG